MFRLISIFTLYQRISPHLFTSICIRSLSLGSSNMVCVNRRCPLMKPKKPLNFLVERGFLWELNKVLPFSTFALFENLYFSLVSNLSIKNNLKELLEFVKNLIDSIKRVLSKNVQDHMDTVFNSNIKLVVCRDLSNYIVHNLLKKYESIFLSFISSLSVQDSRAGVINTYKTNLVKLEALDNEMKPLFYSCNYLQLKRSTKDKVSHSAIDLTLQGNDKVLTLISVHLTHMKKLLSKLKDI
jgi:hypothetical protein